MSDEERRQIMGRVGIALDKIFGPGNNIFVLLVADASGDIAIAKNVEQVTGLLQAYIDRVVQKN